MALGTRITNAPRGRWFTIHDDAGTVDVNTEWVNPLSLDNGSAHWADVPENCDRVYVRAKVPIATTVITTNPRVRLYAGYGGFDSTTPEQFTRLDAVGPAATGVVLTLGVSLTANFNDGTWFHSQLGALAGHGLLNARYFTVLIDQAGAITADASIPIEVLFGY